MKQAILITMYKNVEQVANLIKFFDDEFIFFIHVDKKNKLNLSPIHDLQKENIHIYSTYKTNWGGYNHLKAILLLIGEALSHKEVGYFHLISGEDFPSKPLTYFKNLLDTSKDYIETEKIPRASWNGNGGLDRITFYNFFDRFNAKTQKGNVKILNSIDFQKKAGIKRGYSSVLPPLYGGSTWWSLTRTTLEGIISYTKKQPRLLRRMKFTFCAEEFYIQTVFMAISNKGNNWINDDFRYIKWSLSSAGSPPYLHSSEFEQIILSDNLFARKLDMEMSISLNNYLEKYDFSSFNNLLNRRRILCDKGRAAALPLISIVMPIFNINNSILKESIESILNQTYSNFELIIVDDGSKGTESIEYIDSFHDDRIKIIVNRHCFIDSLNKGIYACQGKYIARMDGDDIMMSNRLEIQCAYMEENPEIDICGSWMDYFGDRKGTMETPCSHDEILRMFLFRNSIFHPTVILRKATVCNVKKDLYKYGYIGAEDYKLWTDLALHGLRFYNISQSLVKHRSHESQVTRINKQDILYSKAQIQIEYAEGLMNAIGKKCSKYEAFFNNLIELANNEMIDISSLIDVTYTVWNDKLPTYITNK